MSSFFPLLRCLHLGFPHHLFICETLIQCNTKICDRLGSRHCSPRAFAESNRNAVNIFALDSRHSKRLHSPFLSSSCSRPCPKEGLTMLGRHRTRQDRSSPVAFAPISPISSLHRILPALRLHHGPSLSPGVKDLQARRADVKTRLLQTRAKRGTWIEASWQASTSRKLPHPPASANDLQQALASDQAPPSPTSRSVHLASCAQMARPRGRFPHDLSTRSTPLPPMKPIFLLGAFLSNEHSHLQRHWAPPLSNRLRLADEGSPAYAIETGRGNAKGRDSVPIVAGSTISSDRHER